MDTGQNTEGDQMETVLVGVGMVGREGSLVTINQPGTDPRTDALLGL